MMLPSFVELSVKSPIITLNDLLAEDNRYVYA